MAGLLNPRSRSDVLDNSFLDYLSQNVGQPLADYAIRAPSATIAGVASLPVELGKSLLDAPNMVSRSLLGQPLYDLPDAVTNSRGDFNDLMQLQGHQPAQTSGQHAADFIGADPLLSPKFMAGAAATLGGVGGLLSQMNRSSKIDPLHAINSVGKSQAGKIGDIKKPKRMSREEAVALGHWDHWGDGKRMDVLEKDMTFGRVPDPTNPLVPEKEADIGGLLGKTGILTQGDTSAIGETLHSINGQKLKYPVRLGGGMGYHRTQPLTDPGPNDIPNPVWAMDKGATGNLMGTVKGAMGKGSDPVAIFSPMSSGALSHNTMLSDASLGYIAENMSKTNQKAIDVAMRKQIKQAQNKAKDPLTKNARWHGVDDPRTVSDLENSGVIRHMLNEVMSKKEFKSMKGIPDAPSVRRAISDERLLSGDTSRAGQSMAQLDGSYRLNADNAHDTYNTSVGGEYYGGIEGGVPLDQMFSSHHSNRRLRQASPWSDPRSFELSKPPQYFDRDALAKVKEGAGQVDDGKREMISVGERVPFGGGGHLARLNEQPMSVKQQYGDDLGEMNLYEMGGIETDPGSRGFGAWSENGVPQTNPTYINKPVFQTKPDPETGLLQMNKRDVGTVEAIEELSGLLNMQAGSPASMSYQSANNYALNSNKADPHFADTNALRVNFRSEPKQETIEALSNMADDRGMFVGSSGNGRYTLNPFSGNAEDLPQSVIAGFVGDAPREARLGSEIKGLKEATKRNKNKKLQGLLDYSKGRKTAELKEAKGLLDTLEPSQVEGMRTNTVYADLEGPLDVANTGQGKATAQVLESMNKNLPVMERILGSNKLKDYARNKLKVDAELAAKTGDVTRPDVENLLEIMADPKTTGSEARAALESALKKGTALPVALLAYLGLGEDSTPNDI